MKPCPCASHEAALDRARSLLNNHGWQLMTAEELAGQCGSADPSAADLMNAYVLTLYTACSGAEGVKRQEHGYTELHAYLLHSAAGRYHDVAADAVQRAIESIYRNFDRCRVPGAFLAFAAQQLLNAARVERRLTAPAEHPLDETCEQIPVFADDPEASLERREIGAQLRACAERFAHQYPRARLQLAALWLKYIEQLDDAVIAARLRRSIGSVQTLRSRAVARLRHDPEWRALAAEYNCGQV